MENRNEIQSMSTDELWNLYEQMNSQLAERITAEKARLDERLNKLRSATNVVTPPRTRRPYPKVLPKYQNPKNPAETWSGRGKQPRWLTAQLRSGKKVNDFLIGPSRATRRAS